MAETPRRARLRAPAPNSAPILDGPADDPLVSLLPVLNLRKCWELASVLNFWHVFRPVIQSGMEVSAEEIEEALIAPNEKLTKLHVALLKGIPPVNKSLKDPDRWVPELSKKLAPWWPWVAEGVYPFVTADRAELTKYKDFDPKTRLLILKALCEIRALQDDVLWYIDDALKHGAQLSNFQKNRIGGDRNGTSFWYDGDSVVGYRLYKEINKVQYSQKIKGQGRLAAAYSSCRWETLATNLEEFLDISGKLASSKIRVEAAVGHVIKNELIPVLQEEQKKKERKLKRQKREQIVLGAFHNSVRIDRSRRGCRPVSYTFDEYDRSINEAIKMSTKGWIISEEKDGSKHGNNNLGGENIVTNRRAQMVPTNGMASSDDDEYQGTRRQGCHDDIDEDYNDHASDNISEESNISLKAEENGFKRNTRSSAAIQRNHQVKQQGLRRSSRTAVCSASENDKASNMESTTIAQTKKRLRQRPTTNSDMVLCVDSGIESEIVDDSFDEGPEMVSDSEES